MAVDAVIFDWGGTLTPWHPIDPAEEWGSLARLASPETPEAAAAALMDAAHRVWERSRVERRSGTFDEICSLAGVSASAEHALAYRAFWEKSTYTDPLVTPLFEQLRSDGIRIGVLSNTVWPREWHEEIFRRDGVLDLIDGDVYSCEIEWTKPDPRAFRATMEAVGVTDPGRCVFVGDRIFDDIHGANATGMKAVFIPHSDVPDWQIGHTRGTPDGVIHDLPELPAVIRPWR